MGDVFHTAGPRTSPQVADQAGDRPADRVSLQHSLVGHLVEAQDSDASLGQPPGIGVAPQDLLGSVHEAPIQPGGPPGAGPIRREIDSVEEPPNGVGRDAQDRREDQPAANRPGAVRAKNPIALAMRRPIKVLILLATLATGAVLGMKKMGVDLPPPLNTPKVHAYLDYVDTGASQIKGFIVRHLGSYFRKQEEEPHHETHKIVITSPRAQDVIITESFVCQIRSQRHIEVRALDSGYLQEISIKEGQAVKKGQSMFKILPVLYEAKYEAEKAEALLAQREFNNTENLYKQKTAVVSQNEVLLFQAKLLRAQANLKKAEAELKFAEVTAPFDGIVDRLLQREGSLIKEGDILTTLSDNGAMWVYFNVPEKYYLEYMAALEQPEKEDKIELVLANGDKFPQTGTIGAIEAEFNNETGNIKFRADFPNPVNKGT
ncbi:MAG TPA: efflux RND transporter periplasmic adaptor subunit, partial [Isosphaeraceae bacterium]|nr:efflux RND transporter periplasmic adaptor subunit [Isosphaeraceae bacterium]